MEDIDKIAALVAKGLALTANSENPDAPQITELLRGFAAWVEAQW